MFIPSISEFLNVFVSTLGWIAILLGVTAMVLWPMSYLLAWLILPILWVGIGSSIPFPILWHYSRQTALSLLILAGKCVILYLIGLVLSGWIQSPSVTFFLGNDATWIAVLSWILRVCAKTSQAA